MPEILDIATQNRFRDVTQAIAKACERSGRDPSALTLIAVTKTFPIEVISKAYALGLLHVGESRVQEMIEKFGDGALADEHPGLVVHLIGHLQSNKVRKAVQLAASIDSVDSVALAEAIDRAAEQFGRRTRILLEVNTSGEAQKFGLLPRDLLPAVEQMQQLKHVELAGLMTVGPNVSDEDVVRQSFRRLREAFIEVQTRLHPPAWSVLSMGMSGDYPMAIEEGATEIRLGTAIFGQRSQL